MGSNEKKFVVTHISNLWPDFAYPKEAILKGDPACVADFYQRLIKEVTDNIATLTNDSIPEEVFEGAQAFDPAVGLFCKVARILKKLNLSISLCDLLTNNPKRNLGFMGIAVHFLSYLSNSSELVQNVVFGQMSKVNEAEELIIQRNELTQRISKLAELLSQLKITDEKLDIELVPIREAYNKMLKDNKAVAEENADNLKRLEKCTQEISSMQCETNCLSNEELELKNSLITDEEYEELKKVESSLELEHKRLVVAESEITLDSRVDERTLLTNCLKTLGDLHLDHLYIVTQKQLSDEKLALEENKNEFQADLKLYQTSKETEEKKFKKSVKSLKEIETILDNYEKEILAIDEHERVDYEHKAKIYREQTKQAESLKKQIANEEAKAEDIENDTKRLNSAMAKEYNKILQSNKRFCNDFYDWFLKTKKSCQ